MADAEGDDGMDDDMMDKISSSPSIDDGGYSLPHMWPLRSDSLSRTISPISSPSFSQACCESSSPYVETPDFYPLRPLRETIDKGVAPEVQAQSDHHLLLLGEYPDDSDDNEIEHDDALCSDLSRLSMDVAGASIEQYDQDYDLSYYSEEQPAGSSEQQYETGIEEDETAMTIPYEDSEEEEEDDDYDIPYADDSRFIDSGWGGECLQELEDIDFEFVYALHTFVATVEGQANATKGDTMVLLDDSNSYWWLVRVVKDSSIGGSLIQMFVEAVALLTRFSFTGYLPAEHIETPTERLARLNKHRNIDVRCHINILRYCSNLHSSPQICSVTKRRRPKTL